MNINLLVCYVFVIESYNENNWLCKIHSAKNFSEEIYIKQKNM